MGKIKNQVPKNFALSVIGFSINFLVGLWLVPYLVKYLGTSAYGFIPLTAAFTQYVSFFTNAIVVSVSRFLSIKIQRTEVSEANKIYSTAILVLGGIVLFLGPLFIGVALNIDTFLSVPEGILLDCVWLFFYSFIAFLINLFGSVFKIPLYANNRLDIIKVIDIVRIGTRLSCIIILFIVYEPTLEYVGLASLIASIVVGICSYLLGKSVYRELKFSYSLFSINWVKRLLSFGGWTFIHQGGDLLIFNIDVLLINLLIGSVEAGEYGTILTWGNLLKAVSVTFSGLFGPVILIYYAHKQTDKIIKVCRLGIKVLNFTLGTLIAVLAGLSVPILKNWLGDEFVHISPVLVIKILPLAFTFAVGSLFAVFRAYNKVKVPAIVTICFGLVDILLVFVFVKIWHWGIIGVALANGIIVFAQGGLFAPYYAAKVLDQNRWYFYKDLILGMLYLVSLYLIISSVCSLFSFTSVYPLIGVILIFIPLGVLFFWVFLFKKADKSELLNLLPSVIHPFIPFRYFDIAHVFKSKSR